MTKIPSRPIQHFEYSGNIHMHTTYSDGTGSFTDLVDGAVEAGLDYVIVTDHNVLVRTLEEGYRRGVLTLVGQEVHDPDRHPPGNHLLCLGVERDLSPLAPDPQQLIDGVNEQGGLAILAHPIEEFTDLVPSHYDWWDWHVHGYHGVELWNYMSGFRGHATSKRKGLAIGFFPQYFASGPLPAMLRKWDELTAHRQVVALGGTDVHAQTYRIGLIRRRFLPYVHCARAVNTHILSPLPFCNPGHTVQLAYDDSDVAHDRRLLLDALGKGHCWIGYDALYPTRGFRFWAQAGEERLIMGDATSDRDRTDEEWTFHVSCPAAGLIRLLRNGQLVQQVQGSRLTHRDTRTGVYRVEVRKRWWGKERGWIFSNPIYRR